MTAGFISAFTTFSGFAWETVSMYRPGSRGRAGAYVLASLLLGVTALWPGLHLGSLLTRAP